ncbi:MAG: hypothetical protein R2706_01780 [Acidimicrobiales bacterium]
MRHRSFYVESIHLTGRPIPTRGGDLVVVRHDGGTLDWELIVRTPERVQIDKAPYDLDIVTPDGDFAGPAIVVRTDGLSHVFRGAGDLHGFTEAHFDYTDLLDN